ncbi:MAG: hypothetical protein IPM47_08805 [Sphingobacteriales bacterium]|nr:MAG: hypothetical protein IPM47_08805 [Sphingobacteriales bacterium]
MNDTFKIAPIPVIIGITGHRDLFPKDLTALTEAFSSYIQQLKTSYPDSPITVMSSLASGADLLAANIALSMQIPVIAPLPLPVDDYLNDFETEEEKSDFLKALDQCDKRFIVEQAVPATQLNTNPLSDRELAYFSAALYVVKHCDVLVAFWNGENNDYLAGTAKTVQMMLEGFVPPEFRKSGTDFFQTETSGIVYHISTPRKKSTVLTMPAFSVTKLSGSHSKIVDLLDELRFLDRFNRESKRLFINREPALEQNRRYLFSVKEENELNADLSNLLTNFAVADTLAQKYGAKVKNLFNRLFAIMFISLLICDIYAHLFYSEAILLVLYLGGLFSALLLFSHSKKKQFESRYLDYRALAEGCRVMIFWQLAGISQSVSHFYMRKQKNVLNWIRASLQKIESLNTWQNDPDPKDFAIVYKNWIEDQRIYYRKSALKNEKLYHSTEKWMMFFFIVGVLLTFANVCAMLFGFIKYPAHWYITIMLLFPFFAVMTETYGDKRAFKQHSKRYEFMSQLYDRASLLMKEYLAAEKYEEAQLVIFELGKETLIENGDWVMLNREKPLDMPKG